MNSIIVRRELDELNEFALLISHFVASSGSSKGRQTGIRLDDSANTIGTSALPESTVSSAEFGDIYADLSIRRRPTHRLFLSIYKTMGDERWSNSAVEDQVSQIEIKRPN